MSVYLPEGFLHPVFIHPSFLTYWLAAFTFRLYVWVRTDTHVFARTQQFSLTRLTITTPQPTAS